MPLAFESARIRQSSQKLAQILEKGPLGLEPALRYATDIAGGLRELHAEGRSHGSVDPNHIVIRSSDAALISVDRRGYPDSLDDLFGFGSALYAMLTGRTAGADEMRLLPGRPGALKGPSAVRAAALRLAERCMTAERETAPEFQKVVTEVKLLHVMAKQFSPEVAPVTPMPIPVSTPPVPAPIVPSQSQEVFAGTAPPVINPPVIRTGRLLPDTPKAEPAAAEAESAPANEVPPEAAATPAEAPVEAEGEAPASARPDVPQSRPFLLEVMCPKCKGFQVRLSRPRTRFERVLSVFGIGVHRCARCYYRYVPFLGRKIVRKSK